MGQRTPFAVLAALALVAALGSSTAPTARADTTDAILADCVDGTIDGAYEAAQLEDALQKIPSDIDEYSDCRGALERAAADARCRTASERTIGCNRGPRPWPRGKQGYTVMLMATTSAAEARDAVIAARRRGVPAGTLDGDRFVSLCSGVRFVWAGRFRSVGKAESAARRYARLGMRGDEVQVVAEK